MSTTDGKAPRFEVIYQHDDGDIVVVLEATFRGDVRKLFTDLPEGVSKEDAELQVATNIFRIVQIAATGEGSENEDGATPSED